MHLIKSAVFNAGILRTAAKYVLNSEYAPISDMRLLMRQYGYKHLASRINITSKTRSMSIQLVVKCFIGDNVVSI